MGLKIRDLMTSPVERCGPHQNLAEVAHVMWDSDCGFVPIVNPEDDKLLGVVTDRDTCMAAAIQGRPLARIPVEEVMTKKLATAGVNDPIERALDTMASHQLRRLPIVDDEGVLLGVLSMNDLFGAVEEGGRQKTALEHKLVEAMTEICKHRPLTVA